MADYGYFIISRKMHATDPFWNEDRPRTRYEAWEDIIASAAYVQHRRMVNGTVVELNRGEFLASLRFLAKRWKWSVKRVRIYLELLVKMERIAPREETAQGTIFFLPKYDEYQKGADWGNAGGTGEGTPENGVTAPLPPASGGAEGTPTGTATGTIGAHLGHTEGTPRAQREVREIPENEGKEGEVGTAAAAAAVRELSDDADPALVEQMRAMVAIAVARIDDAALRADAEAELEMAIAGWDTAVWRDDTGTQAPWESRPALIRLALHRWWKDWRDGERFTPRSSLRYVVRQQQSNPPSPDSPAAKVRSAPTDDLARIRAQREREAAEAEDLAPVHAWIAAHPVEAAEARAKAFDGVDEDNPFERVGATGRYYAIVRELIARAA